MNQYIKAIAPIVHKLPKHKRKAAIEFADSYFETYLDKLNSFDEFSTQVNYEAAINATVAELEWLTH